MALLLPAVALFSQNTFPSTGNVGIGTTTPGVQLDVIGTVRTNGFNINATGNDAVVTSTHGTDQFNLIGTYSGWDPYGVYVAAYNAGNAGASGITTAAQHIYLGNPTWNSNYLSVNLMNGGVGIGTTNTNDPNNRLFVETGIRTRKVTVDQATWPDYVFSPGYRLASLDSLEGYIAANHHLPELPSADSVAKNGVELGAGESALLKKVEELTLYVIELNKQNAQLQKEVDALKAANATTPGSPRR